MSSRWGCSLHLSSFCEAAWRHTHQHVHVHVCVCTHTHTWSSFSSFYSRAEGKKNKEEEPITLAEFRTYQLCLIEFFDLINDTSLHCERNHTQIKKLVMLKISGVRGQLFHSLSELMPMTRDDFANISSHCVTIAQLVSSCTFSFSGSWYLVLFTSCPPLYPHCFLSEAALACQSAALTVLPPSFIQLFIIICCYCSFLS